MMRIIRLDLLWMLLISVSIAIFILKTNYINHDSIYLPEEEEVDLDLGVGLHIMYNDDDNDKQKDVHRGSSHPQNDNDSVIEYLGEQKVPSLIIAGTQKGVSAFERYDCDNVIIFNKS